LGGQKCVINSRRVCVGTAFDCLRNGHYYDTLLATYCENNGRRTDLYFTYIQGAPIKKNTIPYRKKMLYFSHGSTGFSQTLYVSIHTTYPANFIEITDIVPQMQQFKR